MNSILLFTLAAALPLAALAQYPTRPVRIIVPVAAGASLDMLARTVGARLQAKLGQPVVVDNQPGAGGNLAFGNVAKAAPDGQTLLLGWDSLQINLGLYKSVPYEIKSFAPISLAIYTPQIFVANPSVPAKNVRDFIALAKSRREGITMASAGSGSPGHLAGALFSVLTGAQLVHIPYKGGAPAVIDLLAGHVDVLFVSLPTALQHVRSGKLTAYGVSTKARASSLPDVPTLAQAGVKGYELVSWQGFLAPTGTPEAIIERLNTEIVQILRSTEVRDALVSQGYDIAASTPAVLDAELRQGTEKWLSLIRKSGATAN